MTSITSSASVDCGICLDPILADENVTVACTRESPSGIVSPNHFFHEKCFAPWLESKKTCPICRDSATPCSQELLSRPASEVFQAIFAREEETAAASVAESFIKTAARGDKDEIFDFLDRPELLDEDYVVAFRAARANKDPNVAYFIWASGKVSKEEVYRAIYYAIETGNIVLKNKLLDDCIYG